MCLRKKCGANEWCAIKVLLLLVVATSPDTLTHSRGNQSNKRKQYYNLPYHLKQHEQNVGCCCCFYCCDDISKHAMHTQRAADAAVQLRLLD